MIRSAACLGHTIAFDRNLQVAGRQLPVRGFAITGRDTYILGFVGIRADLFDTLSGDVKMVGLDKQGAVIDGPFFRAQIELNVDYR